MIWILLWYILGVYIKCEIIKAWCLQDYYAGGRHQNWSWHIMILKLGVVRIIVSVIYKWIEAEAWWFLDKPCLYLLSTWEKLRIDKENDGIPF